MKRAGRKSRRNLRVASLIREIVSETLVTELSDPRVAFLTVTHVELSEDLRFADVYISVIGGPGREEDCLQALRHAHGYIQEKVSVGVAMKFCPMLRFQPDESVKRSVAISGLIAQARAEDEAARADRIRRGVEKPDENGTETQTDPT